MRVGPEPGARRAALLRAPARDLTQTFKRHRKRSLQSRGSGLPPKNPSAYGRLPATEWTGASAEPPSAPCQSYSDQATLPPEWVDFADKARDDIKEIHAQLSQLTQAQQRRLRKAADVGALPDQDVERLSASIATLIRCCEQSIHQVRTYGRGAPGASANMDVEFRQNVQRSLATELQQVSKQCRESQKQYLAEVRVRSQKAQARNAPVHEDRSSVSGGPGGDDFGSGGGPRYSQGEAAVELDAMEERAAERSHHIAQIVESVNELNTIFKDLANLVIEQGSILDRIDYNTEKIYKKSHDARGQMLKAAEKKKNTDSRTAKCFFIWVGLDLLALVILVLKYLLKYGKAGFLVLTFIFLAIAGCVFACYKKFGSAGPAWEKHLPKEVNPKELWKQIRPGPVNTMKAMRAAGGARMR